MQSNTLFPSKFLNSINISGFPLHRLSLRIGCPIMLLRNLDFAAGLCNGTRQCNLPPQVHPDNIHWSISDRCLHQTVIHNFGYMGPNATTGFPGQYMNHHAPYNTHQPPHQSQPLQEGGMSRHEGQPLGHQMQMGGGGRGPQQQMQMQMPMGGQQSMGGMPMQWPGGQMYYGSPKAYPPPTSMMQPMRLIVRQATTNNHSAPGPEYGHQQ